MSMSICRCRKPTAMTTDTWWSGSCWLTAFRRKRSDWKGYDLAPSSFLPPYAEDLLAAAQWAWVFGGMGSWSDMSFDVGAGW